MRSRPLLPAKESNSSDAARRDAATCGHRGASWPLGDDVSDAVLEGTL